MAGDTGAGSGLFPKTRWTRIRELRETKNSEASETLEAICRAYWYALGEGRVNYLPGLFAA